jgi:uncharacterized protein
MAHFLYKLIPPRPSFAEDMDETEARLMSEHADYWRGQLERGTVVIFGPVAEPEGSWGLAVLEVNDENAARALVVEDPAIKAADAGFGFEIHPMLSAVGRSIG